MFKFFQFCDNISKRITIIFQLELWKLKLCFESFTDKKGRSERHMIKLSRKLPIVQRAFILSCGSIRTSACYEGALETGVTSFSCSRHKDRIYLFVADNVTLSIFTLKICARLILTTTSFTQFCHFASRLKFVNISHWEFHFYIKFEERKLFITDCN